MRGVKKQVAEEVAEGHLQAADDLRDVELLPERQLPPAHDFDSHQNPSTKIAIAKAVTTTLATEIGNRPSQPSRIS